MTKKNINPINDVQENRKELEEKLSKILNTPPDQRGDAARAVLEAFKIYHVQIDSEPPP